MNSRIIYTLMLNHLNKEQTSIAVMRAGRRSPADYNLKKIYSRRFGQ